MSSPYSRWGPAELPTVLCYYELSGHLPVFDTVAGIYLAPRDFFPGLGRLHRLRVQPFRACCRQYHAGSDTGFSHLSRITVAFTHAQGARLPELFAYEDCSTFDTCGLHGCSPDQVWVCQKAPSPAFACEMSSQLHGYDSFHGGTYTRWVVPAFSGHDVGGEFLFRPTLQHLRSGRPSVVRAEHRSETRHG